jgi:PAS domain S-box-containing protein
MTIIGSMRSKIGWTFTLLVALNLAAGFWSIYNFYVMGTTLATLLNEHYRSVLATEKMVQALERQENALLVESEREDVGSAGTFRENKELFYYWYEQAVQSALTPGLELLQDSIQSEYLRYAMLADSMGARSFQGAADEAKHYYFEKVRPVSDRLRELVFRLFEINQSMMYEAPSRTHAIANQSAYGTLMASLVTLVLSILATAWLNRSLVKPAEDLTQSVRQIGRGRLDVKIDVLADDEIGQLSREFNKMTERLRQYELMNIERILAEKRTSEAIVESIRDGLLVADRRRVIVHLNRVMAEILGTSEEQATGGTVDAVVRDGRIVEPLLGVLRGAPPAGEAPVLPVEVGGRIRYLRLRVSPIAGENGSAAGAVLLLQDVTQFKELDRMKSDFIATLSHEFRTPVTSITMSVDLLAQGPLGPLTERQRELLVSAKEDCERLTKLARELLQLSKLESGAIQVQREELSVRSVAEFALRPLLLQFRERGIDLRNEIPADLPPVLGDEQQLSWVITNLVTNALKHTDAGGVVRLTARREGGELRIAVEDTGRGIAPEHLERIFDKFVQIPDAGRSSPGGVGLGLAIAKEIVQAAGGRIWAESSPGAGSTFFFTLPAGSMSPAAGGRR